MRSPKSQQEGRSPRAHRNGSRQGNAKALPMWSGRGAKLGGREGDRHPAAVPPLPAPEREGPDRKANSSASRSSSNEVRSPPVRISCENELQRSIFADQDERAASRMQQCSELG